MPSFDEIGPPVPVKFLSVFTIYGHGSHLRHVTWIISIHINSNFPWMFHVKFDLIGQAVLEKKKFKYYGDIHMRIYFSKFDKHQSLIFHTTQC